MTTMLLPILAPALQVPCDYHPETPARWVLSGRKVCDFCAEQMLLIAEAAQPGQLTLFESMRQKVLAR